MISRSKKRNNNKKNLNPELRKYYLMLSCNVNRSKIKLKKMISNAIIKQQKNISFENKKITGCELGYSTIFRKNGHFPENFGRNYHNAGQDFLHSGNRLSGNCRERDFHK